MSILTFFHPVLEVLSDGRVIRKIVVWALRILAVLVLLGGLYVLINIFRFAFQAPSAEFTIGGLLLGLIFIVAVGCVAQIWWYRSGKIDALSDTTFTVIPIMSILFRAMGEGYATLGVSVGVGGCLFIWFTKNSPFGMLRELGAFLPSAPIGGGFVDGLIFLAYLCVASFLVLVLFYFLAESTLLLVDIAHNMRVLRAHFVPAPQPPIPPAAPSRHPPAPPAAPVFQAPSPAPASRCSACGAVLQPGSVFCGDCGTRLR